ncbi:MAG: peroxiredoxin [Dehalococcoidia bacterium]|nr:peroxiredoxin [Dehalococcoidia bacterium]
MNFLQLIDNKTTEIGARVPDFRLVDPSDNVLRLSDLRGAPAVLYFYPADGTEGCTQEACEFRDVYQDFRELDCAVYGVSPDSKELHQSMISDNQLPFELCVDPDEMMMSEYGVMGEFECDESESEFWRGRGRNVNEENHVVIPVRATFLIDKDGLLVYKWLPVDYRGHASSVRDQLKKSFKFDIAF